MKEKERNGPIGNSLRKEDLLSKSVGNTTQLLVRGPIYAACQPVYPACDIL